MQSKVLLKHQLKQAQSGKSVCCRSLQPSYMVPAASLGVDGAEGGAGAAAALASSAGSAGALLLLAASSGAAAARVGPLPADPSCLGASLASPCCSAAGTSAAVPAVGAPSAAAAAPEGTAQVPASARRLARSGRAELCGAAALPFGCAPCAPPRLPLLPGGAKRAGPPNESTRPSVPLLAAVPAGLAPALARTLPAPSRSQGLRRGCMRACGAGWSGLGGLSLMSVCTQEVAGCDVWRGQGCASAT